MAPPPGVPQPVAPRAHRILRPQPGPRPGGTGRESAGRASQRPLYRLLFPATCKLCDMFPMLPNPRVKLFCCQGPKEELTSPEEGKWQIIPSGEVLCPGSFAVGAGGGDPSPHLPGPSHSTIPYLFRGHCHAFLLPAVAFHPSSPDENCSTERFTTELCKIKPKEGLRWPRGRPR